MLRSLFLLCELPALKPVPITCDDEQDCLFHSQPHTQTCIRHTNARKKWTEILETNKVEWTGKLEIRKDEFLVVDLACMAIGWSRRGC